LLKKKLFFFFFFFFAGGGGGGPGGGGGGGGGEDVPPFVASSHSVKNGHVPWRGCGHTSMQELSSYTPGLNTRNDVFPFLRTHREKEKELRETDNILVHFCCSRFPVQARRNLKPYCKRSA